MVYEKIWFVKGLIANMHDFHSREFLEEHFCFFTGRLAKNCLDWKFESKLYYQVGSLEKIKNFTLLWNWTLTAISIVIVEILNKIFIGTNNNISSI